MASKYVRNDGFVDYLTSLGYEVKENEYERRVVLRLGGNKARSEWGLLWNSYFEVHTVPAACCYSGCSCYEDRSFPKKNPPSKEEYEKEFKKKFGLPTILLLRDMVGIIIAIHTFIILWLIK